MFKNTNLLYTSKRIAIKRGNLTYGNSSIFYYDKGISFRDGVTLASEADAVKSILVYNKRVILFGRLHT